MSSVELLKLFLLDFGFPWWRIEVHERFLNTASEVRVYFQDEHLSFLVHPDRFDCLLGFGGKETPWNQEFTIRHIVDPYISFSDPRCFKVLEEELAEFLPESKKNK